MCPCRSARRSNRSAKSAAWALTSCTQIQSGRVAASQLSRPRLGAGREALGLGGVGWDLVGFAGASGALQFGRFKTKAGRLSPYFFNAGRFDDGCKIGRLAQFYAQALLASGIEFDMVFGPAYKGIPLAATVAVE